MRANMPLDRGEIDRPHLLPQCPSLLGDDENLTTRVTLAARLFHIPRLAQAVDEARHIVLGNQQPALELEWPQAALGIAPLELPQHIVPFERRKSGCLSVGRHRRYE